MNLNSIHLESEEGLTLYELMEYLFFTTLFTVTPTFFTIIIFIKIDKILGAVLTIIATGISLSIIKDDIPELYRKYKNDNTYKVYLDNKENTKEITKEEYDFIRNIKYDYILSETIKEEDINRIREILKQERN
jgi:hypothetical protein